MSAPTDPISSPPLKLLSVIIPARAVHAWGTLGHARVLFIWPVLEPFAAGKSTYVEGAPPRVA